ncbi:MAG: DUF4190 domain-containing protein [Pyrinomonadaceae bacterium]|nr:DUF4190 domain-containing protein [Pyrinomonadaceae bacterium]
MKRCPTCDKTYDDTLRFCQTDGTPLADVVEDIDPFKTMVARPEDIRAAMASTPEPPKPEEPVLDLPEADPNKTQFVSEAELRAEMSRMQDNVVDIPPAAEPEEIPAAPAADQFSMTSPPIPSPFDAKPEPVDRVDPAAEAMPSFEPAAPSFEPPASPFSQPEPPASPFSEPTPAVEDKPYNPFEHSAPAAEPMAKAEWNPPAAPEASWQNQEIGQNTPFQTPPPAVTGDGQNKTLPIISLATGIISICCWVSPITGLIALVTGFLGLKNIKNDPNAYGGKGLAIAGMAVGGIFWLLGVIYWVFVIFFNGLAMMQNM